MFFENVTNTEYRNECTVCFPTHGCTYVLVLHPLTLRIMFALMKKALLLSVSVCGFHAYLLESQAISYLTYL